jgi:hypothetical protein
VEADEERGMRAKCGSVSEEPAVREQRNVFSMFFAVRREKEWFTSPRAKARAPRRSKKDKSIPMGSAIRSVVPV